MSKKTLPQKTPPPVRRRVNVGGKRYKTVGKPGQKEKGASKSIGDSVYKLNFQPLSGIVVNGHLENAEIDLPDPAKMYKDLYACYKRYYLLKIGTPTKFDPVKDLGLPYSEGIYRVCKMFEQLLPSDVEFNIDCTFGGECYFTVYKTAGFGDYFHVLELKYLLKMMRKLGKEYEDLFIDFVRAFRKHIDSPYWFDGGGCYDYVFDFAIHDHIDCLDDEDRIEVENDLYQYQHGEVKQIQKELMNRKPVEPSVLLKRLAEIRSKKPVFKFMKELVELMCQGYSMTSFEYDYLQGDNYGLRVEYQHCIVWDNQDCISREAHTFIEAEAQEGIWDAAVRLEVCPKCKIKFEDYEPEALAWLKAYETATASLYNISDALRNKYESSNRNNNARLHAEVMCSRL